MQLPDAWLKSHDLILGFFSALAHYSIRHPRRVLLIAASITLVVAPGVHWLKLRTDGHALVSSHAPEVIYDRDIRERFGIKDQIVVLIRSSHPDGIFNSHTVQLVRELTAEFARLPEINPTNVISLATEPSFRFRPGTLLNQRILEPALTNKAELDQLRDDVRRIELYTGTLVSTDGKSTTILIGVPASGDRTRLYQAILNIIAARQSWPENIGVTGAPVAESLLGIHILEDLGVPKAWLGTSTRSHEERGEWKLPHSAYELRLLIARRIGLVPVAVLVMMLVFYSSFRNVLAMLLPLPEVAATLLFIFGLMGWFGVPIYLTIAVMPVLLTAMCVTDEIHVFSRYFALLREKPHVNHIELVKETMDEMVCPVVSTTLTTAIGFVSFAFSPLLPVQAFGIFTGIGVLFSLFFSLTVIPAMLTLLNPACLVSRRQREAGGGQGMLAGCFMRLGLAVARHRFWVIGLVVIGAALSPLGLQRLVIQDSWIDGFDLNSEFRRATQMVNEHFHGMHLLIVSFTAPEVVTGEVTASVVQTGSLLVPTNLVPSVVLIENSPVTIAIAHEPPVRDGPNGPQPAVWRSQIQNSFPRSNHIFAGIGPNAAPASLTEELQKSGRARYEIMIHSHLKPEILRFSADLSSFIRQRGDYAVGGVLGPADYLLTTRFMARADDPEARRFPANAEEVKLLWNYYSTARGPQHLREVMDTNYQQSLTTVFLKDANFVDTARLMSDIRAYEREHLTPKGIKVGFAGDVAVSQSLINGIVTTQLQSLIWSLAGIYAVTALFGRSLRWGIYCVLPSALAVVINFAVMGWFGIPLGVATSMFAGMTLGIGVDFAIHMLEGYELARSKGDSLLEALNRSMALTGPPVLINTMVISLGFGVLMFSQVPANARLGMLLVLGMVGCFIASLLILPILLHWWPLKDPQQTQTVFLPQKR